MRAPGSTRVSEVALQHGGCLELVPMDPNFHDISVSLYEKNGVVTVWTFSNMPGVRDRIRTIRDQLVSLGGLVPIRSTYNQAQLPCGELHARAVKFLMAQAVEKPAGYALPESGVKDLRSPLILSVGAENVCGRWLYKVVGEGDASNKDARLRAVTAGYVRYGEMEKVNENSLAFPCGYRHDELALLVLPYARNVSQVEDTIASEALRGQMTTGTLGFSPPT